jgi:hypothetical protein
VGKPEISIEAPVEVHGLDLALLTASLSSSELSPLLTRLGSGRRALPIDGTSPGTMHHKSYIIESWNARAPWLDVRCFRGLFNAGSIEEDPILVIANAVRAALGLAL